MLKTILVSAVNRVSIRLFSCLIVGVFLAAGAQAKTITVDGNIADWSDVPVLVTDPVGDMIDSACGYNTDHRDLASIKTTSDAQNLYYLLQYGRNCSPYNGLFLWFDTDLDSSTGCQVSGIGADMLLSFATPTGTYLFGTDNFCGATLRADLTGSVIFSSPDGNTTYVEGSIPLSYFSNSSFKLQSSPDELSAPAVVSLTPTSPGWLWPIKNTDSRAKITQDFAEYQSVVKADGTLTDHHTGFDIGVPIGTPVVATGAATVVLLQRNRAQNGTCKNINTLSQKGNCGDHGNGNTIILQHRIGSSNFPQFIYSQYQHLLDDATLSAFDAALEAEVKAKCSPETPSGMLICPRDANSGEYPVVVQAGDQIGLSGQSGRGGNPYAPHLHFEFKSFATLGAYNPDKQKFEYGYTPNLPETYGYYDPSALLEGISDLRRRWIVKVKLPTLKHIGPRNDYSCGLYIVNPTGTSGSQDSQGCPPSLGSPAAVREVDTDPKVGDIFIAFQEGPPTPGCSLGWYQVAKSTRDISLPKAPGKYFQRNLRLTADSPQGDNLSRDGLNPDAWICRGDSGVEWVAVFRTGDVNNDGVADQKDVCAINAVVPRSAGLTDLRDLNGDGRINLSDVDIAERLCSTSCARKMCP